jgi:ribosome-associated protein
MDKPEETEGGLPDGPSKSQIKRELLALQELAERMTGMPRAELERLGLSEATWAAIDETARIKDLRARRRHFKRIAKLLAAEDMEAARALVDDKAEKAREAAARHHWVERWRERLLEEGDDALTELLDLCPHADRQRLRQLMRAARRDTELGRADAPRKLFRFLREALEDTDLS